MQTLMNGIYSALSGDANLSAHVSARIYPSVAPEEATSPYIVYHIISATKPTTFKDDFFSAIIQFDIWDKRATESDTEVHNIWTDLDALLDRSSISVTGYTPIFLRHELEIGPEKIEDYWHLMVQYRGEWQKN